MKKLNLTEATVKALTGKLEEVYTKEYISSFDELYDSSWGPAKDVLKHISDLDLEEELMNWLEDFGSEDNPIDRTELNDYIAFDTEDLYEALGLDINGDPIGEDDDEEDLEEGKKVEARSHKEDNEKVAPRFITTKNGNLTKARHMVDVTNPAVGNKSYHNERGNQYWGTTEDEYASKRNKTGQKNDNGTEQYLADYDEMQTPVKRFQYLKGQAKSRSDDAEQLRSIGKRVRAQYKKDYYNAGAENAEAQAKRQNAEASDIVNKERERIANKNNKTDENLTENKLPNQKSREYRKAHNMITKENKRITERYDDGYVVIFFDDEGYNPAGSEGTFYSHLKTKQGAINRVMSPDFAKHTPYTNFIVITPSEYDNMSGSNWEKMGEYIKQAMKDNNYYKQDTRINWYERYDIKKEERKKDRVMSFEDWVDYIDIKKSYPDWFKDKKELDRPFLDVINDHMEELERDYRKYKKSQSKKKDESIKLEGVQGNNQGICPKCGSMITNYGEIFWNDDGIGQAFDCTNPECKAHGVEYYNTTFDYIEIED